MEYQTRQERRARRVTYVAVQADWFRREETLKHVAIPVTNVVDMMLKHGWRLVQKSPVPTNVLVNTIQDWIFVT